MNVLALEPHYGGSHQAFLDNWRENSRHQWTVLSLPAYKWKWRMRHAAVTFAEQIRARDNEGERWHVVWASDMLNLAEFLGLAPERVQQLPSVAYFHENQLTYPARNNNERDHHFAFTNFTTALAADQCWFNSAFHQHEFLAGLRSFLSRMPDFQPLREVDAIAGKSGVHYPGIVSFPPREVRGDGAIRILWNARWEHDKAPEEFFEAIRLLKLQGTQFRLSVLGQSFSQTPAVFEWARDYFADAIDHWGYVASRSDYASILMNSDVVVSTANHEFFGIGVVEAMAAGVHPLLPARLAYPEILRQTCREPEQHLYDGGREQLASRLSGLAETVRTSDGWMNEMASLQQAAGSRFGWNRRAIEMDDALEAIAGPVRGDIRRYPRV